MTVSDYITASDIKAATPDGNWSSTYDTLLASLASDASRAIDSYCGWWPGAFAVTTDSARVYDGSGVARQRIDPLCAEPTLVEMTLTGDLSAYTTIPATNTLNSNPNYYGGPVNALASETPYYVYLDLNILYGQYFTWYQFPRAIRVTGKWGFATTAPAAIQRATLIQAVRWFKRGQQAFQDTGAVLELGQLTYTKALDPEVGALIDSRFRRVAI